MKYPSFLSMLILALFLVSMPVLAVDLELTNSFSQEIFETTTSAQEELVIDINIFNIDYENRLFAPPSTWITAPAHPWEPNKQLMTGYAHIESDDPNEYLYTNSYRYYDHPSFLGVA